MRVYISGRITGELDFKIKFRAAQKYLEEQGHQVINPAALEEVLPPMAPEEHLKYDLCLLEMCDAIYMLRGWEKSCGANREYGFAAALNKLIMKEGAKN